MIDSACLRVCVAAPISAAALARSRRPPPDVQDEDYSPVRSESCLASPRLNRTLQFNYILSHCPLQESIAFCSRRTPLCAPLHAARPRPDAHFVALACPYFGGRM
jgi:hypothetical protein